MMHDIMTRNKKGDFRWGEMERECKQVGEMKGNKKAVRGVKVI